MLPKTFLIVLLFVSSLNLTNLPAQDSGCATRTVPVSVVDEQWLPVQGLSAANFRGKLRGRDLEILSASIDTRPRRIVLLLDASGSMIEEGWEDAKSLSEDLIRFAPAGASIAQMGFSDAVLDTAGFDQDRLALLKRLAALAKVCEQPRKTRQTALFDAIASARGTLDVPEFGDVIYVVTDAGDNKSRTEPKRVAEDLLRAGVRLFAVVVAYASRDRGRRVSGDEDPERLLSVVIATGGNVLAFPYVATSQPYPYIKAKTRADAVGLALQRFYQQMGKFYRLDLSLPATVSKPTEWNLEVIGANGKPNRRVEVRYPQRLMPCAGASP
jgi:hypothetical protein